MYTFACSWLLKEIVYLNPHITDDLRTFTRRMRPSLWALQHVFLNLEHHIQLWMEMGGQPLSATYVMGCCFTVRYALTTFDDYWCINNSFVSESLGQHQINLYIGRWTSVLFTHLLGGNDENYETLQSGQPICRLG